MIKSYLIMNKKYYEVYVARRDRDKKLIARRKRGITSEQKAKDIEFELKTELLQLTNKTPAWTWANWKLEILRRIKLRFKMATLMNYQCHFKKWIPESWDSKFLHEITAEDIYTVIEVSKARLSPVSQQTLLKILKRVFQEAVDSGIIANNPAKSLSMRANESVKKVLTTDDVSILLESARTMNHRFYPIWCFAVKTGMRSGEMQALLWPDVDFERNLISVSKQWTKKDGTTPTKSRENRVVPISDDLKAFLMELHKSNPNAVFVLPRLIEWTHGEQAKVLKGFCKGIGITPIKFHDLRATFITNMLLQGVPLVKVMSIVGHKTMKTTDIYLRLAGVDIQGATNALSYKVPIAPDLTNVIPLSRPKNDDR